MRGTPQDVISESGPAAIRLQPGRCLTLMLGIIALLTTAGIATDVLRGLGHAEAYGLVRLFNTSHEANVPAFYSSISLLGSAILLWFIANVAPVEQRKHWKALAALLFLLSLDESAQLHELMIRPTREFLHASGVLYFGWVIVAIPILAAIAVTFVPFVLRLPKKIRRLMATAASMLVFGAVGMEMVGAPYAEKYGEVYLPYRFITDVEEFLEMVAVALWNYALLCHLHALLLESNREGIVITTRL